MTKFKVGDRVRSVKDSGIDISVGDVFKLIASEGGEIQFRDRAGDYRSRPAKNYELADRPAIDWTKPIEAVHEDGRVVVVALTVCDPQPDVSGDYYTTPVPGSRIDTAIWKPDGTTWNGNSKGWHIRNVSEATDSDAELAALRQFKADAIARFPELSEPETDEQAARRFQEMYNDDELETSFDVAKAAIAWARSNPR